MPNPPSRAEQHRAFDALLTAQNQNQAHASQLKIEGPRGHWNPINPDGPLSAPQDKDVSAMFLKPAQLAKSERVLRIIDFIDKIVQSADERTISELGTTKLVVSYGSKNPKLENVTLAQWVIGNTRIFHTLLQGGKLPSIQDVQHYLGQVKINISFPSGITKNMRREVLIICYFVNFCYFPKYLFTSPLLPIKW